MPRPTNNMSESILDTIAQATRQRVAETKARLPLDELAQRVARQVAAEGGADTLPFEAALAAEGLSFICEVKKASPSKGLIAPDFSYVDIARDYEAAGAAAISCLTEPQWFMGSLDYLREITQAVRTPVLRKDFVVDAYQIYEAKEAGAAAVLLICSILSPEELAAFQLLAHDLHMAALVEAHSEAEVRMALDCGARIVGVNNRNLGDFSVDFENCLRLRSLVPADVLFVAESGVHTADDVRALADCGVDAVLVGEALMRAPDKAAKLQELRSQL